MSAELVLYSNSREGTEQQGGEFRVLHDTQRADLME